MTKQEPLAIRLYFDPAMCELARLIGYGGIREADLKEKALPLLAAYGAIRMNQIAFELTVTDEATRIVTLKPHVRKVCWQLLGPPPGHELYEVYWEKRGGPPAHHQPAGKETVVSRVQPAATPSRAATGSAAGGNATNALPRTKRQLLCMLRDARKKLSHHGKRSFIGKKAKKEVTEVAAELKRRGLDAPPDGQDTAKRSQLRSVASPAKRPVKKR